MRKVAAVLMPGGWSVRMLEQGSEATDLPDLQITVVQVVVGYGRAKHGRRIYATVIHQLSHMQADCKILLPWGSHRSA